VSTAASVVLKRHETASLNPFFLFLVIILFISSLGFRFRHTRSWRKRTTNDKEKEMAALEAGDFCGN